MKKDKLILIMHIVIIFFFIGYLITGMVILNNKEDKDYSKVGIDIKSYQIEYGINYGYNSESKFKIYKIKDTCSSDIKIQIENNPMWGKDKLYYFVMQDIQTYYGEKIEQINKENLYYYSTNGLYAMYEPETSTLYYFSESLCKQYNDYSNIFGINISKYISKEIYNVKDSVSGEGIEYYVYDFSEENGKEIENELHNNVEWTNEKIEEKILENYNYNEEVNDIKNGFYHYKLVCRTLDKEKGKNPTSNTATGFEIGVYDADKNRLYYYWYSI